MARAPFQILVYLYRRDGEGQLQYALLRRSDAGFWQAVAGGGEDAETPTEAGRREVSEEAGIGPSCALVPLDTTFSVPVTCFRESYPWGDHVYVVPAHCFGLDATGCDLTLSPEHTECRWLSYPEASALLHYDSDRTALWELDRRLRGLGPR